MRGTDRQQSGMFSYISAERRVPKDHPLRVIRTMVDLALRNMGSQFETMYAKIGRPSIPPDDPGNPTIDFHGERRSNATHQSTTDSGARLARKGSGKEAKLSYAGHVVMENRNGIAVNGQVTEADGRAEPRAAVAMVEEIP